MTLAKRLLIILGTAPMLLSAAATTSVPKTDKSCERGCPLWSIDEFERFFNTPFSHMNGMYSASSIKENDKSYLISIDLPGIDKKDIKIESSGNRLIVFGERKEESESKEGATKSHRQFYQSFTLPDDADIDKISATSSNGVLKLTVPKSGKKVSKTIEIK